MQIHTLAIALSLTALACTAPRAEDSSVPQSGNLPAAVSPFPAGLSGELVFQSDIDGRPKIFKLDLASGRVTRLTDNPSYRDEGPRWSPDGSRISFVSNRAHYEGPSPEQGTPDMDVYVMDANGGNVRRLTREPSNEADATWAPDGRSLVVSSDRDSRGDLYRLWLADGRVERLTTHFVGRAIMPTVSPDGRTVAFAAQTLRVGAFWHFQVHGLDLATRETRPLSTGGASCWPAWAPDGRRLAFVLLAEEPSGLGTLDLASGRPERLVSDRTLWSYYPDWAPDGRRIAFSVSPEHHDGEDWDLALTEMGAGGRFVRLTTGRGNDRLPDWKP
jgi:TolB protein